MPFGPDAGKKIGLDIWRIEKMEPVPIPDNHYGQFHSGDCYIILHSALNKSTLVQNIHFWLGKDSSQDERGAAAYQTVYLDDLLNGRATQHREVQEHESQKFLSYFPRGIQYLDGGIESGFRHVDRDAYETRLFHLKGKRNVRVQQVALSADSLNDGDVFILDLGLTLIQWNGKHANKFEKFKGLEMLQKIKDDERGGRAATVVLESGKNDDNDAFWAALGGKKPIKDAEEGGADDDVKEDVVQLFHISDASGSMVTRKVAEGKLERSMLDSNDVFVLDSGTQLFVWVGKGANTDERKKGMEYGQMYLAENNRPAWTPLTRVIETGEPPVFRAFFTQWEPPRVLKYDVNEPKKVKSAAEDMRVDALYSQQARAEEKMVDDGSGEIKIWRIENMDKVPVDPALYGQFYQGDSYILLYTYLKRNRPAHIIYFWQGRDSSQDEKAASAFLSVSLDDELQTSNSTQVRVVQGKEPNHFLSLFKGKMIVHQGGAASGFKNRAEEAVDPSAAPTRLYHIHGTTANNTRAVEVLPAAGSLNSGDCFVLLTPGVMYVWAGVGANDEEIAVANTIASILQAGRSVEQVAEGSESEAFWDVLGGRAEYATSKTLQEGAREPRLFQCTTSKGGFRIEEIFDFSQDDLINDDVMILDAFEEVFVWCGNDSTMEEKDLAVKVALEYVKKAPDGRSPDTPVFRVRAGAEPPNFVCHFHGWSDAQAEDFSDPYAKKLASMSTEAAPAGAPAPASAASVDATEPGHVAPAASVSPTSAASAAAPAAAKKPVSAADYLNRKRAESKVERVSLDDVGFKNPSTNKYKLEQLVKANEVPEGVDPSRREQYLSDADFSALFKMTIPEFNALPAWKQKHLKQQHKLF